MLNPNYMKNFTSMFSATFLLDLMNGNNLEHFRKVFNELKIKYDLRTNANIRDILDGSYNILLAKHRNEYVYKNILISYIKSKELESNYTLFSEMDIGSSSRVDIANFSSSNHAYEIKTELDSFSRLDKQLQDYKKGFEYVWAIVPEQKLKKLLLIVDSHIGIKVLDTNNRIVRYREAQSSLNSITHGGLFSLLRQKEFLLLLKMHYGHEFNIKSFDSRAVAFGMFESINIEDAHKYSVDIIKNRVEQHSLKLLMGSTPSCLLPINLNQGIQKKAKTFLNFLDSSINELDHHIGMMQHRKLF